jgi:hypothetical protein
VVQESNLPIVESLPVVVPVRRWRRIRGVRIKEVDPHEEPILRR